MTSPMDSDYFGATLVEAHKQWLERASPVLAKQWEDRLTSEPEAATAEAMIHVILAKQVDDVRPYEHESMGGPDFCCRSGSAEFLVECTVIKIDTATDHTGLPPFPKPGATRYTSLNLQILGKIKKKAGQVGPRALPLVLAVATLHYQAGRAVFRRLFVEWMLSGPPSASSPPELGDSVFFKRTSRADAPAPARRNVSAILLLSLGEVDRPQRGLIHPRACRSFDPDWLPQTGFCRLKSPREGAEIHVEWVSGSPSRICTTQME